MEENTHSVNDFLKTYGTLIVAGYAVIQVWIIALWKKYFRKGKLSIFKTGQIEIGYSNFGPAIALAGTLRAEFKPVFISEISLKLIRLKDTSTHKLEWTAFRSSQLRTSKEPISLDLPSSFNVSLEQPHRYNIFFSDRKVQNELTPFLNSTSEEWNKFITSKIVLTASPNTILTPRGLIERKDFDEFTRSNNSFHDAWDQLQRKNYWEEGEYQVTMAISAPSFPKEFAETWKFTLSKQQSENLRLNSVVTLNELCLVDSGGYNFIYLEYQ
jgi:hypothetical protein